MRIGEFQEIIRKTYIKKDQKRGLLGTFRWFIEEVGELAKALKRKDKEALQEEFADVFAWLVSIANLTGCDLERITEERYGKGCPKCGKIPCECPEPGE
jgi:NTP pyrophosphatase (non-canonical NTP hydrolase)